MTPAILLSLLRAKQQGVESKQAFLNAMVGDLAGNGNLAISMIVADKLNERDAPSATNGSDTAPTETPANGDVPAEVPVLPGDQYEAICRLLAEVLACLRHDHGKTSTFPGAVPAIRGDGDGETPASPEA